MLQPTYEKSLPLTKPICNSALWEVSAHGQTVRFHQKDKKSCATNAINL